jgi:pilus assembly protein Flp/PilA
MLTFLKAWFTTRVGQYLPKDEKGQDAAEYGLLVALIAVALIIGVTAFGTEVGAFFTGLAARLGMG